MAWKWSKRIFQPKCKNIADNELGKREKIFKSTVYGTYLPATNEDNAPCCWFCKQTYRLMNCQEFMNKSLHEKKHFIVQNSICWNYLSKSHFVQNCNSHFRCKIDICGQMHHTLLHKTSPNTRSGIEQVTINSNSLKSHTFLQIILVTISHSSRTVTIYVFFS